ncbi:MAG: DUF3972 domain-containing protein [Sulfurovum sp.]|nr:DUF3972 domain-containing protein [Sulfurovum sp.]
MGNLIKPADYAIKMGISRQAVYAKIKKGILSSRNIGGKILIVLDNSKESDYNKVSVVDIVANKAKSDNEVNIENQEKLLEAKEETIAILRETISDLKETNKMISSTLRGEVELLKEAFSEMKMLYGLQLEHKKQADDNEQTIEVDSVDSSEENPEEWMELHDFFALHGITKEKKQKKIKKQLKKRLKKGDSRIDRFNGEILFLANADFEDIFAKA